MTAILDLSGPIAGDAVSYLVEAAEFFDIGVDYLGGSGAMVETHWLGGFKVAPRLNQWRIQEPSDSSFVKAGRRTPTSCLLVGISP